MLTIVDAATRAAVAAATDQAAQLEALAAPFVTAGAVTVRVYVGATHAATCAHGAWTINAGATPRTMSLGARNARTGIATGAPTRVVFRAGATDIMEYTAGVGSGDISFAAAISADAAERIACTVTATASLPVDALPSWVPTTAWQWTSIPGTIFTDYMKNDGSGIAPAAPAEPTGGTNVATSANYAKWTSYGGPAYSRKNHELYMFGGGHAATTINALCRWNLSKNSPDMTLLVTPTTAAVKQANWTDTYVQTTSGGYWPDGKPMAVHGYMCPQYLDSVDTFIMLGLMKNVAPFLDQTSWNAVASYQRAGSAWDAASTWPAMPETGSDDDADIDECPVFTDWAGNAVYYYKDRGVTGPYRKLTAATKTHASLSGGSTYGYDFTFSRGAARHDQDKALLIGGLGATTWQAQMLDLTTGTMTAQSVTGAWPGSASVGLYDLAWVSSGGYWVAMFANPTANDGVDYSSVALYKLEVTGTNALTATLITTTGTPPAGSGGCSHGMVYDDFFDCLIVMGKQNEALKALKVS